MNASGVSPCLQIMVSYDESAEAGKALQAAVKDIAKRTSCALMGISQ
jgi:hypothetical protein